MNDVITIKVNTLEKKVQKGMTILAAARESGIKIPTLCFHEDMHGLGNCGICVVEIKGKPDLVRACITPVEPGMEIITHSNRINQARRSILSLILANHPNDCLHCVKNGKCDLQDLAHYFNIKEEMYDNIQIKQPVDDSFYVIRDTNKCILCRRCLVACQEVQTVYAIESIDRGFETHISTGSGKMSQSVCTVCGQCISVCPVAALYEKQDSNSVWEVLKSRDKIVIVQEAPAVRVSLAEEFGLPPGTNLAKKMYSALKMLGFDYVFDTNFSADLTIMEEGNELIERVKKNEKLPLITSCSPGWINFMEIYFSDLLENVSSCKSPQQMFGAMAKTYFAREYKLDPSRIVTVSIMPCTAKKFEADRPEMRSSGFKDVDFVLTTREFVSMLKEAGIDLPALPDASADEFMGTYSGAGTIFGATGGVAEAALRTAYLLLSGTELEDCDIRQCRGIEGIKAFEVDVAGTTVKCAVAHGLGNARKLLTSVQEARQKGELLYHFIEIMSCTGGCVGGGGEPFGSTLKRRLERARGLYSEDEGMAIRKSHQNPMVKKLYDNFLIKPLSEKSHHLLHTHYQERDKFA